MGFSNRKKLGQVMIVAATLVCLISACAKPYRPGQEKSVEEAVAAVDPQALKTPAEYLQLRLITAEKINAADQNAPYPDRSVHPVKPRPAEEVIASGEQIYFKNTIQLAGAPLFMTFDEEGFGVPIRRVDLTHTRQNALNQQLGNSERREMYYDEPSKRWFISIAELLGGDLSQIGANDLHLVRLDLYFPDDSKAVVYVSFHATGPVLPVPHQFRKRGDETRKFSSAGEYVQNIGRDAFLGQDEISNPSDRPLRLWVRARTESQLKLRTTVGFYYYQQSPGKAPSGPYRDRFASDAEFVPGKILVQKSGEKNSREVSLGKGWTFIDLEPQSSYVLSWIGQSLESKHCYVPSPIERTFTWQTVTNTRCVGRGENCEIYTIVTDHSQTEIEKWEVLGAALSGLFSRELRLSDPALDPELATAEVIPSESAALVASLTTEAAMVSEKVGSAFSDAPSPEVCQGVGWN